MMPCGCRPSRRWKMRSCCAVPCPRTQPVPPTPRHSLKSAESRLASSPAAPSSPACAAASLGAASSAISSTHSPVSTSGTFDMKRSRCQASVICGVGRCAPGGMMLTDSRPGCVAPGIRRWESTCTTHSRRKSWPSAPRMRVPSTGRRMAPSSAMTLKMGASSVSGPTCKLLPVASPTWTLSPTPLVKCSPSRVSPSSSATGRSRTMPLVPVSRMNQPRRVPPTAPSSSRWPPSPRMHTTS
mmetsp:Transcript_41076/g.106301  ORF Transcript_41076/g.106301 Transcript_41076/m.106301 type:complete len:241 (+) Transcript_41076:896-1618(+)